jgi:hypothetical protein
MKDATKKALKKMFPRACRICNGGGTRIVLIKGQYGRVACLCSNPTKAVAFFPFHKQEQRILLNFFPLRITGELK